MMENALGEPPYFWADSRSVEAKTNASHYSSANRHAAAIARERSPHISEISAAENGKEETPPSET